MSIPLEKQALFHCDNGKTYLVYKYSCFLCRNSDIFYDYTNGPYLVLCSDPDGVTDNGLCGECDLFKEV